MMPFTNRFPVLLVPPSWKLVASKIIMLFCIKQERKRAWKPICYRVLFARPGNGPCYMGLQAIGPSSVTWPHLTPKETGKYQQVVCLGKRENEFWVNTWKSQP